MSKVHRATFGSIDEWAKVAIPHLKSGAYYAGHPEWAGFDGWREVETLARDGWQEEAATALEIAESAVSTVSAEVDMPAFATRWDVTGADVDVARFLDGEPECMIDYDMVQTPRAGRIITLVASVTVSSVISVDAIKRRGYAIAALAFALTRMGLQVELWADHSQEGMMDKNYRGHQRVLVKGANDDVDEARIMFAFAHPGMLRGLGLASMHEYPTEIFSKLKFGYGIPIPPEEDMPEGTIYLPSVTSDRAIPKPEVALMGYLRTLGIVE